MKKCEKEKNFVYALLVIDLVVQQIRSIEHYPKYQYFLKRRLLEKVRKLSAIIPFEQGSDLGVCVAVLEFSGISVTSGAKGGCSGQLSSFSFIMSESVCSVYTLYYSYGSYIHEEL